jgi:hypothetical protein
MTTLFRFPVHAAALAAVLAVAAPAHAQNADAGDDQNGWWSRMGHMMEGWSGDAPDWARGMGRMMGLDADEVLDRIEGRLAFVKAELKITPEQEAAWNAFADTMRKAAAERAGEMAGMIDSMKSGAFFDKPLPARLADQEARLQGRLDQVKAVRAAVDQLYASLSEEQKKSADDIVMPMMGMGGRGMGWWR